MRKLYILDIKKQKKFIIIIPVALFVAFYLYLQSTSLFTFSSQEDPAALHNGNKKHSSIAITFNISHGTEKVEPILAQLAKLNTKATFFVSGEWAERHPDLLEKIVEEKHEIGMLGYQYSPYQTEDIQKIKNDITKAKTAFEKLGYKDTYLYRTPNGYLNEEILKAAELQGLKTIHWSINPNDWKNPGTDKITDHVLSNIRNGSIVLLHASDSVKQTEKALQKMLPEIQLKKFSLVTISELITNVDIKQQELK
ncbi:polysaccharide deacetylase family protein [Gracilibacillus marinus]|jgi:peptidoglycan-N-acetylglucosamine deacetylase|uniref:Polysaccharide deacetylase family protein n=1 Tax=Gracilibacillus marinus TaxID=630535 RepID=A0ABV8W1E5_9BACI